MRSLLIFSSLSDHVTGKIDRIMSDERAGSDFIFVVNMLRQAKCDPRRDECKQAEVTLYISVSRSRRLTNASRDQGRDIESRD